MSFLRCSVSVECRNYVYHVLVCVCVRHLLRCFDKRLQTTAIDRLSAISIENWFLQGGANNRTIFGFVKCSYSTYSVTDVGLNW